jgi:hypothetical protein
MTENRSGRRKSAQISGYGATQTQRNSRVVCAGVSFSKSEGELRFEDRFGGKRTGQRRDSCSLVDLPPAEQNKNEDLQPQRSKLPSLQPFRAASAVLYGNTRDLVRLGTLVTYRPVPVGW